MTRRAEHVDFGSFAHPVYAVPCPNCGARRGTRCKRPSSHAAMRFHEARGAAADALFVAQHGEDAWIERLGNGGWRVHPTGRDDARARP